MLARAVTVTDWVHEFRAYLYIYLNTLYKIPILFVFAILDLVLGPKFEWPFQSITIARYKTKGQNMNQVY